MLHGMHYSIELWNFIYIVMYTFYSYPFFERQQDGSWVHLIYTLPDYPERAAC